MRFVVLFFGFFSLSSCFSMDADFAEEKKGHTVRSMADVSMGFFDLVTGGVDPKVAEYMARFECSEEVAKQGLLTQQQEKLNAPSYSEF